MKLNFREPKGFTLVELLLVVGIIALGSVVAYITLPKVQSSSRTNAEVANINTLSAGIKNMYAGKTSFATLVSAPVGTALVIKAKAAPDKMINEAGTGLVNGFGGVVTVSPGLPMGSVAGQASYRITYNGVPDAECNKIVNSVGNSFIRVVAGPVASQGLLKSAPGEFTPDVVMTPKTIAESCVGGDNNIVSLWGR